MVTLTFATSFLAAFLPLNWDHNGLPTTRANSLHLQPRFNAFCMVNMFRRAVQFNQIQVWFTFCRRQLPVGLRLIIEIFEANRARRIRTMLLWRIRRLSFQNKFGDILCPLFLGSINLLTLYCCPGINTAKIDLIYITIIRVTRAHVSRSIDA